MYTITLVNNTVRKIQIVCCDAPQPAPRLAYDYNSDTPNSALETRHEALRAPTCSTSSTTPGTRGSTRVARVTFEIQAGLVAAQN